MTELKDFDQHNDIFEITDRIPECLQGKRVLSANDLLQTLRSALGAKTGSFLDSGVPCRVMAADKAGWQKGRMVIKLEFVPDPLPELQDKQIADELSSIRNQS
ncbi:hypothetical protein HCU40_16715 [Pseudanabaena biceps]|nr:hypothetical protein [Pseudanabaena biceps]